MPPPNESVKIPVTSPQASRDLQLNVRTVSSKMQHYQHQLHRTAKVRHMTLIDCIVDLSLLTKLTYLLTYHLLTLEEGINVF